MSARGRAWLQRALLLGTLVLTASPDAWPADGPVPDGFVDLSTLDNVRLDVRYATSANFTGAPLDGYGSPSAWLREAPARALGRVASALAGKGYALVVHDGYRPVRASRAMVAWAERTGNAHLVADGWVAARSGHNRGHVVDVSLADKASGSPVDMGSPYDAFVDASVTANATGEAAERRALLVEAMAAEGFTNYRKEWWHFSHASGPYEPMDLPYPSVPAKPCPAPECP